MPQNTMLLLLSQILKTPKAFLEGFTNPNSRWVGVCLPNAAERSVLSPENQDPIPLPANVWSPGASASTVKSKTPLRYASPNAVSLDTIRIRSGASDSGRCPSLGAATQRAVSTYRSGFESSPAGPPNRPHERLKGTTARCSTGLCSPLAAFIVPTKLGLGAWSAQGSSLKEEGGAPALRSRLALRSSAPLTAAANQRPARRGHFLVGRQGGQRSSLVRVSRIGCARVPSGRGQRRLGAQFPSACGAPAAEPGSSA